MRTLALSVLAVFVAVVSFAGTALAASGTVALAQMADVAPPDASWLDIAKPVLDAAIGGHPLLACALALVLAVSLARTYGGTRFPFLKTDAGGTALTFLGTLGTALAASLATGSLPTWGLFSAAMTLAAGASGGYTAIRRLAAPALRWLESKLPAKFRPFLAPVFNVLLWAFESRKASPEAVAKAEAAGDAAVKAKPAEGVAKVTKSGKSFP